MRPDQLIPFTSVSIDGRNYPAPRDVEAWLTLNYDADWRTPIPGFELATPEMTSRRFENWFGSFDFGRHFWNSWYSKEHDNDEWRAGGEWILSQSSRLTSSSLIELGAGDGWLSAKLAHDRRRVIAADYAHVAVTAIEQIAEDHNLQAVHANFYRLSSLALPQDASITGRFDVVAHHLLEQVGHLARPQIYRLIRMALHSGGTALATMHTLPASNLHPEIPTTWHLTQAQVLTECATFGLTATFTPITENFDRRPTGIIFSLDDNPQLPQPEVSMKQRIVRALRSFDPSVTRRRVRELESEVSALKSELDEYRAQNAKLAELLDIVERKLTPPATDPH